MHLSNDAGSVVVSRLVVQRSLDRSLMVDPLSYISFDSVLHNRCTKGRSVYYLVSRTVLCEGFDVLRGYIYIY